jgi:hypothetical protein
MRIGIDDAEWLEDYRLRRLHGDSTISRDEIGESKMRRARLRGRVLLTDPEWSRLDELRRRWRGGGFGVNDPDWDEWRSLEEVADEWHRLRRFPRTLQFQYRIKKLPRPMPKRRSRSS